MNKYTTLFSSSLLALTLLLSGCGSAINANNENQTISHSGTKFFNEICFDGLVLIESGASKYRNGFFYKRDLNGSVIPCSMEPSLQNKGK